MEQKDLLKNGLKIFQDKERFCYGIDAVLLSDFCKNSIKEKDFVFDLGTGTGIIPLLLAKMTKSSSFTALEIQADSAKMAAKSVEENNLQSKIKILNSDIKNIALEFPKACATVVTANPPYMTSQIGKESPNQAKAIARHEILCNLEDVVKGAAFLLKPKGSFFMIHRPGRLSEIFVLLNKYKLEPKVIRFVLPHPNEEPTMLMVKAVKNGSQDLRILPALAVRNPDGSYTEEINRIYNFEPAF